MLISPAYDDHGRVRVVLAVTGQHAAAFNLDGEFAGRRWGGGFEKVGDVRFVR
jgi:hypothetical protein